MTEVEQPPPTNGIDLSANEEDDNNKARPADIEQDMREMERRKRVEAIMGSKLFREELERIVDSARDSGNTAGILQQLSDIVGLPASRVGNVYKASNCMVPINDIRGVESMGYAKGEKILRCKLAATFRLLDLYGWTQGLGAQITARLKVDQEYFLVNPYGLLYHEITASSLNKVDMQGHIVEQGTTNFGVNKSHFVLHSALHAARPDIRCAIYIGCSPVVAISSLKTGLLPLTKDACVLGEVSTFAYSGCLLDEEERNKLVRNLGPNSKVMLLTNHGALCCGETIEEAFFAASHIVQACETQLKLLPVGLDNLILIPEETRKTIYDQSRRPPEDLAKKFAAVAVADSNKEEEEGDKKETVAEPTKLLGQTPKWRVGGAEYEALMRMLDNAGYRTGYIYRHPLIKSEPPKPKNDVELPPAVSSLGYLLEEEELFRQGIWKKGVMGKGGDRSRWLNSPNVYQKVEVLETGTPDPKKITKWVAEGSPTHSTAVRIDDPLQFVPVNTNPKEFKRLQQQIKDNRRADKISAGPQSHILEGVTWDEANRIKDATVSQAGDHVVLMGAASKGIIQRGFQHNATVYKAPYAKNPFDNVTDDELNEYKRTVERKKKSIHGEYTDTDFSESEALSSLQTSGAQQTKQNTTTTTTAAVSQSEPEDISEHQVMRIQTQQAPVPSQPEVVLSDATLSFINGERSHTATHRKPPTGRDIILANNMQTQDQPAYTQEPLDLNVLQSSDMHTGESFNNDDDLEFLSFEMTNANDTNNHQANSCNTKQNSATSCNQRDLFVEMHSDALFQKQKAKVHHHTLTPYSKKTRILNTRKATWSLSNSATHENDNDHDLNSSLNDASHLSGTFPICFQCQRNRDDLNILKSQIDSSLFYNTSSMLAQDSPNNSLPKLATDYSNIYDYSPSPNNSFTSDQVDGAVKIYRISSKCYTPQVCAPILETLQKPSHLQQHYLNAHSLQDLIWNTPYRHNYSSTITSESVNTTPGKATNLNSPLGAHLKLRQFDNNCGRKSRSPYRTLSHFGFNSPQRQAQPIHKHIVTKDCTRYKAIRRSVSYEEIFASPRFVDLCENCFEKIVRLKPELMKYRLKLRNLMEFDDVEQPRTPSKLDSFKTNEMLDLPCGLEKLSMSPENVSTTKENRTDNSIFTYQLEPLIEVDEKGSSEKSLAIGNLTTQSHCTFLDKVTHLNFSEVSNNFSKTPHTVASQLSWKHQSIDGAAVEEPHNLKPKDNKLAVTAEASSLNEANINRQHGKLTINEIWDFNNWLQENAAQNSVAQDKMNENLLELQKDLNRFKECEKPSKETQTIEPEEAHQLSQISSESTSPNTPRSLMNREERTRRKLEFQEIWEDHLNYYENREHVLASGGFSDTESARDETQQNLRNQAMRDFELNQFAQETYQTQSLVFPHQFVNPSTAATSTSSVEILDEDLQSSSSKQTFVISDKGSSEENLLCRNYGCINLLEENVEMSTDITATEDFDKTPQNLTIEIDENQENNAENVEQQMFFLAPESANNAGNFALGQTYRCADKEPMPKLNTMQFSYDEIDRANNLLQPQCLRGYEQKQAQSEERKRNEIFDKEISEERQINEIFDKEISEGRIKRFPNNCNADQRVFISRAQKPEITKQLSKETIEVLNDHLLNQEESNALFQNFGEQMWQSTKIDQATSQQSNSEREMLKKPQIFGKEIEHREKTEARLSLKSYAAEIEVEENRTKDKASIYPLSYEAKRKLLEQRKSWTGESNKENAFDIQSNEHMLPLIRYKTVILNSIEEKNLTAEVEKDPKTDAVSSEKRPDSKAIPNTNKENVMPIDLEDTDQHQFDDILAQNYDNTNVELDDISQGMRGLELKNTKENYNKNRQDYLTRQREKAKKFESEQQCSQNFSELYSWPAKVTKSDDIPFELQSDTLRQSSQKSHFEENITSLSAVERKILQEIELHQLNKSEEIFNKIENTIKSKLTPSKLEILMREQLLNLQSRDEVNALYKLMPTTMHTKISLNANDKCKLKESKSANTPFEQLNTKDDTSVLYKTASLSAFALETSKENTSHNKTTRRSRSLTPLHDFTPVSNSTLNTTTSPPLLAPRKRPHLSPDAMSTPSSISSSSKSSNSKQRNFILENIRNASMPRNSPPIKRLQAGNSQAIFGKNPFGNWPAATTAAPKSVDDVKKNLLKTYFKSPSPKPNSSKSTPNCNVYSFEAKLVRGSPRFWVSLSQSPVRKSQPASPKAKLNKRSKRKTLFEQRSSNTLAVKSSTPRSQPIVGVTTTAVTKPLDSSPSVSNDITKADAEINALTKLNKRAKRKSLFEQRSSNTPTSTPRSHSIGEVTSTSVAANLDSSPYISDDATKVDAEFNALGLEIQELHPRLETYKRKLDDFGDRVAKCARSMDECMAEQEEIVQDQLELKEQIVLQQYVNDITCRIETFSLSETED